MSPTSPTSPTILLVEDDDGDALAIERAFRKSGIQTPLRRAYDGVQALEILQGAGEQSPLAPPFLLLVDLNLPRINGIELIETVRSIPSLQTSIVFVLTTSNRPEDKNRAYELNVAGYLLKSRMDSDFQALIHLMHSYQQLVAFPD